MGLESGAQGLGLRLLGNYFFKVSRLCPMSLSCTALEILSFSRFAR